MLNSSAIFAPIAEGIIANGHRPDSLHEQCDREN